MIKDLYSARILMFKGALQEKKDVKNQTLWSEIREERKEMERNSTEYKRTENRNGYHM